MKAFIQCQGYKATGHRCSSEAKRVCGRCGKNICGIHAVLGKEGTLCKACKRDRGP